MENISIDDLKKKAIDRLTGMKLSRRAILALGITSFIGKKPILSAIDKHLGKEPINEIDLMLGYKFASLDETVKSFLTFDSVQLLASYSHGFPKLREDRSTFTNIMELERRAKEEVTKSKKDRIQNWHRLAALPGVIAVHCVNDVPRKAVEPLNQLILSKLQMIDQEDQITLILFQTLISKLNYPGDYILGNEVIQYSIELIEKFKKTGEKLLFLISYIAIEFLLAYKNKNLQLPIYQKRIIDRVFESILESKEGFLYLHKRLINSYPTEFVYPQISEVVLSFPDKMKSFKTYDEHWKLSTMTVLKHMHYTAQGGVWSSDEMDFRMKKMCSIYFRERGISNSAIDEIIDSVPSTDSSFRKFLQKDFVSIAENYSTSDVYNLNQEYFMKRWIPLSEAQPQSIFDKIVNRRQIYELSSEGLKQLTTIAETLFPVALSIELISFCKFLRKPLVGSNIKQPSAEINIPVKEVKNRISTQLDAEDEALKGNPDLEDYCREVDKDNKSQGQ